MFHKKCFADRGVQRSRSEAKDSVLGGHDVFDSVLILLALLGAIAQIVFGLAALGVDLRDDSGRLTRGGKLALTGILVGGLLTISAKTAEYFKGKSDSVTRAVEIERMLREIRRGVYPLQAANVYGFIYVNWRNPEIIEFIGQYAKENRQDAQNGVLESVRERVKELHIDFTVTTAGGERAVLGAGRIEVPAIMKNPLVFHEDVLYDKQSGRLEVYIDIVFKITDPKFGSIPDLLGDTVEAKLQYGTPTLSCPSASFNVYSNCGSSTDTGMEAVELSAITMDFGHGLQFALPFRDEKKKLLRGTFPLSLD